MASIITSNNNFCFVCSSSVISFDENKVNKLDALFLLRILLEIPPDNQLSNNIEYKLNYVHFCNLCEKAIKHCKQIYSEICEQVKKFRKARNIISEKFNGSQFSTFENSKTDDELSVNRFIDWVDQCRKFVKDCKFIKLN